MARGEGYRHCSVCGNDAVYACLGCGGLRCATDAPHAPRCPLCGCDGLRTRRQLASLSLDDPALLGLLDGLLRTAVAEPHKLLNAVEFTRGDDDLCAGVELDA